MHVVLLLIIIQQCWHDLCAEFLYAQIFSDNLSHFLFPCTADLQSFEQSTDNHDTPPALPA